MQPVSIQTALAGGSKHSSCLSAQKRTLQQQETSWDFCISPWQPPQPDSPGTGAGELGLLSHSSTSMAPALQHQ